MATAFTAATTIEHPASEVWERLIDWESAPRWMPGVEALRAEGPTTEGTILVFTARGKERRASIAALDPGRNITLRNVQGAVVADYVYECVADGRGTRVTLEADCTANGLMRPLGPLIRYAIRRADGRQLERFADTF